MNLNDKVEVFRQEGTNKIQVISDFNKTFTLKNSTTSFSVLRKRNYLTPEYREESQAMFDKYNPIETGEIKVSQDEINKAMGQWWREHIELLIKHNIDMTVIKDIVWHKKFLSFKRGADVFLEILKEKKIPITFFSAGLGDIIEEFLISQDVLKKNIHDYNITL